MTKTYVFLEIDHAKPVPHVGEKAAQRVYCIDGVDNCEVHAVYAEKVPQMLALEVRE